MEKKRWSNRNSGNLGRETAVRTVSDVFTTVCVLTGWTLARVEWKKWAVITTHKLVEEEFWSGLCWQYIFHCDFNALGFNRESE